MAILLTRGGSGGARAKIVAPTALAIELGKPLAKLGGWQGEGVLSDQIDGTQIGGVCHLYVC